MIAGACGVHRLPVGADLDADCALQPLLGHPATRGVAGLVDAAARRQRARRVPVEAHDGAVEGSVAAWTKDAWEMGGIDPARRVPGTGTSEIAACWLVEASVLPISPAVRSWYVSVISPWTGQASR